MCSSSVSFFFMYWYLPPTFLGGYSVLLTEGLTALSVRCMQPAQQHGRRWPLCILSRITTRCRARVSGFATVIAQQIHSLRASGVILSQTALIFESATIAFCISAGSLCAVPPRSLLIFIFMTPKDLQRLFLYEFAPLSISHLCTLYQNKEINVQ